MNWSIEFIDKLSRKDTLKLATKYKSNIKYKSLLTIKYNLLRKLDRLKLLQVPLKVMFSKATFESYYELTKDQMIRELGRIKVKLPDKMSRIECLICFDLFRKGLPEAGYMMMLIEKTCSTCTFYSTYVKLLYSNFGEDDICDCFIRSVIRSSFNSLSLTNIMFTLSFFYDEYGYCFDPELCGNNMSKTLVGMYVEYKRGELIETKRKIDEALEEVQLLLGTSTLNMSKVI